jgi:hypothetical protein
MKDRIAVNDGTHVPSGINRSSTYKAVAAIEALFFSQGHNIIGHGRAE